MVSDGPNAISQCTEGKLVSSAAKIGSHCSTRQSDLVQQLAFKWHIHGCILLVVGDEGKRAVDVSLGTGSRWGRCPAADRNALAIVSDGGGALGSSRVARYRSARNLTPADSKHCEVCTAQDHAGKCR